MLTHVLIDDSQRTHLFIYCRLKQYSESRLENYIDNITNESLSNVKYRYTSTRKEKQNLKENLVQNIEKYRLAQEKKKQNLKENSARKIEKYSLKDSLGV